MHIKLSKITTILLLASVSVLQATTLQETIDSALLNNSEIKSISKNNEGNKYTIDEAQSSYKPKLDLDVTGESKKTETDNGTTDTEVDQEGFTAKLTLEQLLYDGGSTSSQISEAKFAEKSNRLLNENKIDKLILESIKVYLDLVKYKDRFELAQLNVKRHEGHLKTAIANEELTDNALERYEVQAKLHAANILKLDESKNNKVAKNSFYRITKIKDIGNVTFPNLDKTLIPKITKVLVAKAKANNYAILAKKAQILEQQSKKDQTDSVYMPTLKFYLSGSYDDSLVAPDSIQNLYSARVTLNYNFYNGGSDKAAYLKELQFLKEKEIDLTNELDILAEDISSELIQYNNSLDKLSELEGAVSANEKILSIYQQQFESGTKTFVDVLTAETDLYDAKKDLIDENNNLGKSYYTILTLTSEIKSGLI